MKHFNRLSHGGSIFRGEAERNRLNLVFVSIALCAVWLVSFTFGLV